MKLVSLFAWIAVMGTPIGAAAAISIGVHGESTDTGAAVLHTQIDASHADTYINAIHLTPTPTVLCDDPPPMCVPSPPLNADR